MDRTYRVGDELHLYAVTVCDPKWENSEETEEVYATSPIQAKHLAREDYRESYGTPYASIQVVHIEILG